MVVLSDQFVLCKAALIFAVTKWLLSFALNLLTNSATLDSSACSSSSLRMVKDSLSLTTLEEMEYKLSESDDVTCAVCLNKLRKKSQVWELSNCNHVFHKNCLERWLANDNRVTCPLCRASLLPVNGLSEPQQPSWAVEKILYLFGDDLLR